MLLLFLRLTSKVKIERYRAWQTQSTPIETRTRCFPPSSALLINFSGLILVMLSLRQEEGRLGRVVRISPNWVPITDLVRVSLWRQVTTSVGGVGGRLMSRLF